MFISRDLQVVEKYLADNQRIKMSESQGWDLYAAHTKVPKNPKTWSLNYMEQKQETEVMNNFQS